MGTRLVSKPFDMEDLSKIVQGHKPRLQNLYDHLWYFFWSPISLVAKIFIEFRWVQRSRFAPWVLGACWGVWPDKVHDDHYKVCVDCETCHSLSPGEVDIDDDGEIKHDPFGLLRYRHAVKPVHHGQTCLGCRDRRAIRKLIATFGRGHLRKNAQSQRVTSATSCQTNQTDTTASL